VITKSATSRIMTTGVEISTDQAITLSKTFVPTLRVGWMTGPTSVIGRIAGIRPAVPTFIVTTMAFSLGAVTLSMAPVASAQTVRHHVILYNPAISKLNTVHIEGRVEGIAHPTGKVTLLAEYADIGQRISEIHVHMAHDGEFSGNLQVKFGRVTFVASYPGASSAGVTRYFNAIGIVGSWPNALAKARTTAHSMGAALPVKMPTCLPQQLGASEIHDPFYSTTVAAKSFTYTTQIFQTEKPFPVNDQQAINTPLNREVADVSGSDNASASKAYQQLMWHASQVLPTLSGPATPYADVS